MPYIPASHRPAYDPIIEALQKRLRENGAERGDVNYVVTRIALGVLAVTPGYKNYSDAISALQDAADEIKRRCLGYYEDFACDKNGDVHEYAQADNKLEARWDEFDTLKRVVEDRQQPEPQDATVLAGELYQDLQAEIKETFERR